jgi:NO-binding membrane sensor protein with MHYT domain
MIVTRFGHQRNAVEKALRLGGYLPASCTLCSCCLSSVASQGSTIFGLLCSPALCLFSCATAIGMLGRARRRPVEQRLFWLGPAGTVAGCGIWGTHVIAMLAFAAGLPVGYDGGLMALSLVIAPGLCAVGFALALRPRMELLGGALTGAAISAMHYVGMAAVRTPARAAWDINDVVASVLIGVVFTGIAMRVSLRGSTALSYAQGVLFFTLAICGMHFTGMTGVTYVPNPLLELSDAVLDPTTLALAVAAGAILIVALGLTGVIVDYHLAGRALDETKRLRACP